MNDSTQDELGDPGSQLNVETTAMQLPARAVNTAIERAKTATDMRVVEVSEALAPAYARASTLELTDEEVAALMAPFPDSAVDIRPHDGLIFLSHINISDRLNRVFKPGKWALVCRRHWLEGQTLYGEYILLIRGVFIGESVGGHNYVPSNPKTNYSDSLESTAAEALRRIAGKRLSCGSQVWHRDYAERWVATYAEQVHGKWRKKAISSPPVGAGNVPKPSEAPKTPPAIKTPVAPATALTTAERRAKLVASLEGYDHEACIIFRENGLILPTEDFRDISDFTLERIQPANLLALIKEVKQRRRDADQIPGAEVPDEPGDPGESDASGPTGDDGQDIQWRTATVEAVTSKAGTNPKTGKLFTRFGFKLDGEWFNSFDTKLFDVAKENKGKQVRFTSQQTDFGHDLTAIEALARKESAQ